MVNESIWIYAVYAFPLMILFLLMLRKYSVRERAAVGVHQESVAAGLTLPPSLHPVVDPGLCIGCESCVHACPEFPAHQVLGLVQRKAVLVSPTDCIGHGACKSVCPVDAISLVFGTIERGVEIPNVAPDFSTEVRGIYIAGELGGMGLIRNAIAQGRQAMAHIVESLQAPQAGDNQGALDVVIVGAGPSGMAATLGAMEAGLSYRTIEQSALGGTVASFPKGKLVMTAPAELPIVGKLHFTETTKEELMKVWSEIQQKTDMTVHNNERLLGIARDSTDTLTVTTDNGEYRARRVLLAIGRRGTPRRLGVPGEEHSKVVYSLQDPSQYQGRSVLVVGGGDSALEAACSIVEESAAEVSLSYRSESFSRAKLKNRQRVETLSKSGRLRLEMSTVVTAIEPDTVLLERGEELLSLENDAVIVCAGGILPAGLLSDIGIGMETKYGTA
ncbi:MAG: NAD(P)-binding domain-containing protein [Pseudomonadales bacterium]